MEKWINLTDYTVNQQILFLVDAICWMVAYGLAARNVIKYKFLEIPLAALVANFAWELVYSFALVTELGLWAVWGIRAWFLMDVFLLYALFKYGRKQVKNPYVLRYFNVIIIGGIIAWSGIIYLFHEEFGDPIGGITGYILNIMMSFLYIMLFFNHPQQKALSLGVAVWKMIGTAVIGVAVWIGDVPQPFVIWLAVITFILDLIYTFLLMNRKKFQLPNSNTALEKEASHAV
ncbi:transmembrane-type terpene cyclase [Sediminitomix flava]|uniref:Uncharacterized protein n=1 Tax=Sediminitomix flava TaxID=379075 RepID=A0A315ZE99_SEDFL|nr:hypothetical protein [Sediminitomix flava]PWJ43148.1 hypothetical protein BC781_102697 [Sediminitomix flava]